MKKIFSLLLFFVSIFNSIHSNALSLGNIQIESALNQALRATIQIKNAESFNSEEIIVRVADKKHFTQAGIEYLHFYNQLKFTVSKTGEENIKVKIQSHDPVVEPFLNFIIEMQTPQGKSFKQYTLLVEPKSYQ